MGSYGSFDAQLSRSPSSSADFPPEQQPPDASSSDPHLAPHGDQPSPGWDYLLVFPYHHNQTDEHSLLCARARQQTLARLRAAQFAYAQTWLPTHNLVLVYIALNEEDMQQAAERLAIQLPLLPQYGQGYLPFTRDRAHVFENELRVQNALPYFTPALRLRITTAALTERDSWGAAIRLETLRRRRFLTHACPLHSEPDRSQLLQTAVYDRLWRIGGSLPTSSLRHYFGSRVTIYFAWLIFYARMLTGIALLSIPIYILLTRSTSLRVMDTTRLLFGLALCFWATYWFEHWKRRNFILNVKWGLTSFNDDSQNNMVRPDFRGVETTGFYSRGGFVNLSDMHPTTSPPTISSNSLLETRLVSSDVPGVPDQLRDVLVMGGRNDPDFRLEAPVTGLVFADLPLHPFSDKSAFKRRLYLSATITLFFSLCVGIASFNILFHKSTIVALFHAVGANRIANSVPGIATALLISVSDPLWKKLSSKLTDWENHRTNQSYENSLIVKHFAFQFVSNYVSLFYIAFVKPFTPSDPCIIGRFSSEPDCMHELEAQLTSLLITRATIQQLMEVGVPSLLLYVKRFLGRWKNENQEEDMSEGEREQLLAEGATLDHFEDHPVFKQLIMTPFKSTIEDYGELVIQHGYLVMFGLAFPLAAVINMLNNVIETRTDLYKYLAVQQRPDADEAEDIGTWLVVLRFLSVASAITTAGLVTITTPALQRLLPDFIGDSAEKYPAVSFIIFEHLLLWIRSFVGFLVGDKPSSAYRTLARQDFLKARCFNVGWKPYYRGDNMENSIEYS